MGRVMTKSHSCAHTSTYATKEPTVHILRAHSTRNSHGFELLLKRICRVAVRNKLRKCIAKLSVEANKSRASGREWAIGQIIEQASEQETETDTERWLLPLFGNDSRWPLMYAYCVHVRAQLNKRKFMNITTHINWRNLPLRSKRTQPKRRQNALFTAHA